MFGAPPKTPQPAQTTPAPEPVKFEDIHVMPERFLASDARKAGGGKKKNTLLIVILLVVLLIGGGAAATVFFLLKPDANTNENANVLVVNNAANPNLNSQNLNTGNTNQLFNANSNVNAVTNSNRNINQGLNTNTGLNTNQTNLNSNSNVNAATNANGNGNTNTAVTRTEPLPSTLDTDSDGLTDVEEAVYGTRSNQPDSDGDSFIDGKRLRTDGKYDGEFYNSYNPLGIGRLDTSGLVRSFTNTSFNYAILYPSEWVASATKSDNRTILFNPSNPTGETIQVMVEDNPSKLTAKNYYLSVNPGVDPTALDPVVVNGLEGVRSPTGEDVYLAKNDKVYRVHYAVGQLQSLNFMTTFEMMFQNFRLTSAA